MEATGILCSMEGDTIRFKNNKIAPPEMYLGTKLQLKSINGHNSWSITSVDYINTAVKMITDAVKGTPWQIPKTTRTPMTASFVPELDMSPPSDITLYQEIISML